MRILLVEDDETVVTGLLPILEGLRHAIDVAGDATDAIERMSEMAYDLLILEVSVPPGPMLLDVSPRQAGEELLRRLRSGSLGELRTPTSVRAAALTTVADLTVNEALRSLGVSSVLYKPIDAEEAIDRIRDLLGTEDVG